MYVGVLNVTETLQYMALGLRKKSRMTERFPTRRINGPEKREESTAVYSEHEGGPLFRQFLTGHREPIILQYS